MAIYNAFTTMSFPTTIHLASKQKDNMLYILIPFCRYQRFFLQDEDSMLINGVLIKQSLVDQIMNTAHSIVPNNVAEVNSPL